MAFDLDMQVDPGTLEEIERAQGTLVQRFDAQNNEIQRGERLLDASNRQLERMSRNVKQIGRESENLFRGPAAPLARLVPGGRRGLRVLSHISEIGEHFSLGLFAHLALKGVEDIEESFQKAREVGREFDHQTKEIQHTFHLKDQDEAKDFARFLGREFFDSSKASGTMTEVIEERLKAEAKGAKSIAFDLENPSLSISAIQASRTFGGPHSQDVVMDSVSPNSVLYYMRHGGGTKEKAESIETFIKEFKDRNAAQEVYNKVHPQNESQIRDMERTIKLADEAQRMKSQAWNDT